MKFGLVFDGERPKQRSRKMDTQGLRESFQKVIITLGEIKNIYNINMKEEPNGKKKKKIRQSYLNLKTS